MQGEGVLTSAPETAPSLIGGMWKALGSAVGVSDKNIAIADSIDSGSDPSVALTIEDDAVATLALVHVGRTLVAAVDWPGTACGNGVWVAPARAHGGCVPEDMSTESEDAVKCVGPRAAVVALVTVEYLAVC